MKCTKTVKWLYRNEENFCWQSDLNVNQDYVFRDNKGKIRLIIGTPDGAVYDPTGKPKTYYASMVHDALYQFLDAEVPITREQADKCFLQLMEDSEFVLSGIYWFAVRIFGQLFWKGKRKARQWRGEAISVQSIYADRSMDQGGK